MAQDVDAARMLVKCSSLFCSSYTWQRAHLLFRRLTSEMWVFLVIVPRQAAGRHDPTAGGKSGCGTGPAGPQSCRKIVFGYYTECAQQLMKPVAHSVLIAVAL